MKRRCLAISRWWRASHRQPVTPSPWADRNTPTLARSAARTVPRRTGHQQSRTGGRPNENVNGRSDRNEGIAEVPLCSCGRAPPARWTSNSERRPETRASVDLGLTNGDLEPVAKCLPPTASEKGWPLRQFWSPAVFARLPRNERFMLTLRNRPPADYAKAPSDAYS